MLASPKSGPERASRVFLSYSRRDEDFVTRLEQALIADDFTVYVDRTAIEKGVDWWQRIRQLIAASDAVIFVLSPDALQSDVCARELDHAVSLGKRLIPVVHRKVAARDVPEAIASINYIFFDDAGTGQAGSGFDGAVNELVAALRTDIGWVREHTRLGELARHWDAMQRPQELLLHGQQLRAAVEWLDESLMSERSAHPDDGDLTHRFIQASAQASYRLGIYSWRYRLLMIPAIIIVTLLAVLVAWIVDGVYDIGILRMLGVTQDADFIPLIVTIASLLFGLYVAGSIRRRYVIARRVDFQSVASARWFALRTVIYNLLWLGALFLALMAYVNGAG